MALHETIRAVRKTAREAAVISLPLVLSRGILWPLIWR